MLLRLYFFVFLGKGLSSNTKKPLSVHSTAFQFFGITINLVCLFRRNYGYIRFIVGFFAENNGTINQSM